MESHVTHFKYVVPLMILHPHIVTSPKLYLKRSTDSQAVTWLCRKHVYWKIPMFRNGYGSKPWYLVNIEIAGKWIFIPLKMYL